MRSFLRSSLLALLLLTPVLAAPHNDTEADTLPPEELRNTVFNNIEVPPLRELTGDTFSAAIKDGYWYDRDLSG
jgi:hypothetical protein